MVMIMVDIRIIKKRYEKELMKYPNVIGVGTGEKTVRGTGVGKIAIIVNVRKKVPRSMLKPRDIIPEKVGPMVTDVVELGDIRFLEADRRERIRPVRGGYSIGNVDITAGTLGCVLNILGVEYLLSNAHVFTSDATQPTSQSETIIQPGPYDGGRFPTDIVAKLEKYIPIRVTLNLSECNLSRGIAGTLTFISKILGRQSRFVAFAESGIANRVDAAIAMPLTEFSYEIEGIGIPTVFDSFHLNQIVRKSGRTTGITEGVVTQENVTISVGYSRTLPLLALFEDQVIISGEQFSQGGDSGSAILRGDKIVGLLFAGNESGSITIANRIENVIEALT